MSPISQLLSLSGTGKKLSGLCLALAESQLKDKEILEPDYSNELVSVSDHAFDDIDEGGHNMKEKYFIPHAGVNGRK